MARFVINNKLYDTSKMDKIGSVKKWYPYQGFLLKKLYGDNVGRDYECELYCSKKGNWLLIHEECGVIVGEAISENEAKNLLLHHNYNAYLERFEALEEA